MAQPAWSTNRISLSWPDKLLLSAAVVGIVFACTVLAWMVWQVAPDLFTILRRETPAPAIAQVPTTSTPTPLPTATPTATSTPVPPTIAPPTATHTVTPSPTLPPTPSSTPLPPQIQPAKTIVIDLSEQTLTAYENDQAVYSTLMSSGTARYPTPVGDYAIHTKIRSQTMSGPGYSLPNVQFVAYFYRDYAIHGTYWHNNFGHPMSHGCVNLRNLDAQWLYQWAPIGTPVSVRQ
jgi:lipoprotein-anchoring transpeptidase ErfK/SrfK